MKSLLLNPPKLYISAFFSPLHLKLGKYKTRNPPLSMDVVSWPFYYREELRFRYIFNLSAWACWTSSQLQWHSMSRSLMLSAPVNLTSFNTFIKWSSSHVVEAQSRVHVIYVLQKSEEALHLLKCQPLGQRKDSLTTWEKEIVTPPALWTTKSLINPKL